MSKCPKCNNAETNKYDEVKRLTRNKYGEKEWIHVKRYKCKNCNFVYRDLPHNVLRFKHYSKDIIEGVINGWITPETVGFEDYPCEETMKRWLKEH